MAGEHDTPVLWPHDYRILFDLALHENDHGEGMGHTVRDLYPVRFADGLRRRRAASSMRVLERLQLVDRMGKKDGLVRWITTSTGWETVFRFEVRS